MALYPFLTGALLLGSAPLFAAGFYSALPAEAQRPLEGEKTRIVQVLARDPDLVRDAGAASPAELSTLRFDFQRAARLHDFDYEGLGRARSFEDIIVATQRYSVPLCVGNRCSTMALFSWTPGEEPQLHYVGRTLQQQAFDQADKRARSLHGDTPKLVATDVLNYVYIPDEEGGYLISATEDQERDLAALAGLEPSKAGPQKISLNAFRAIVQERALLHRERSGDEGPATETANAWAASPAPVSAAPTPSPAVRFPAAAPASTRATPVREPRTTNGWTGWFTAAAALAGLLIWIGRRNALRV